MFVKKKIKNLTKVNHFCQQGRWKFIPAPLQLATDCRHEEASASIQKHIALQKWMHSNDFDQIYPYWGHPNHIRNEFACPTFLPLLSPFNSALKDWSERHLMGVLMPFVCVIQRQSKRPHFNVWFVDAFLTLNDSLAGPCVIKQRVFEPNGHEVTQVHVFWHTHATCPVHSLLFSFFIFPLEVFFICWPANKASRSVMFSWIW